MPDDSAPWPAAVVEALCAVLASTEWPGLKGPEIGRLLQELRMEDPTPELTKRHRLFNAMAARQNADQSSKRLRTFAAHALDPARYIADPDRHVAHQQATNEVLAMVGLGVNDRGQLVRTQRATTLDEVAALAGRLQSAMKRRGTHPEVYLYCEAELLRRSVFHAVFEATKELAQRLRDMTGSTLDGSELVDACFAKADPVVRINAHLSKSDISEHSGSANLLRGVFGTFRNPLRMHRAPSGRSARRTRWACSHCCRTRTDGSTRRRYAPDWADLQEWRTRGVVARSPPNGYAPWPPTPSFRGGTDICVTRGWKGGHDP